LDTLLFIFGTVDTILFMSVIVNILASYVLGTIGADLFIVGTLDTGVNIPGALDNGLVIIGSECTGL
jgi:hypothetical protein